MNKEDILTPAGLTDKAKEVAQLAMSRVFPDAVAFMTEEMRLIYVQTAMIGAFKILYHVTGKEHTSAVLKDLQDKCERMD